MAKKLKLELDFDIGDFCYVVTDMEQQRRIVTEIIVKPTGVVYGVSCGTEESYHYGFELTAEKSVI